MAPRVDSPTVSSERVEVEMDEEEDVNLDSSSLTSRPFRRVPTPMGQSHTTGNTSNTATGKTGGEQGEDCLFDKMENIEKGTSPSVNGGKSCRTGEGFFFGSEFETLSNLRNKANYAASRGRQSIRELVYGANQSSPNPSSSTTRGGMKDGTKMDNNSPSGRALSMFNAITKPFLACSSNFPKDLDDAVGEIVANAATVVAAQRSPSDDFSKNYSYDDEYDEARQIRRMTSWNTLETSATALSYLTDGTDTPLQNIFDDDGNPIPNVLVDLTKEMRQKRSGRRKRVVKFDYPPISSLKECPRPDPDDLPNLYFTEDELNQIEDDRVSTTVADDVEVVCVSASESSESPPPYESRPLREMGEVDESDTTSLLPNQNENDREHQASSTSSSQQQKQRRYRGRSPAPRSKKLFGRSSSVGRQGAQPLPPKHPLSPTGQPHQHEPPPDPYENGSNDNTSQSSQAAETTGKPDKSSSIGKRLIKSVHIFMRERSRERSAEI